MITESQVVSFVTDILTIFIIAGLVIVATIFVPYRKSQNSIFLTATFFLFASSVFSIVTDVFALKGSGICEGYYKTYSFEADPEVMICIDNLRAVFSALAFAFLILFLEAVLLMKIRLLKRFKESALMAMLILLGVFFFGVFYLSLTPSVARYEFLGFLLQVLSASVAVVIAGALPITEFVLLRKKYRAFVCGVPEQSSEMVEICNSNCVKGVVFGTGKVIRRETRNEQLSPLIVAGSVHFNFIEYLSFICSLFLFLSVVLFLHVKFAWGNQVDIIESILLQVMYALFILTAVFLLTGQPTQQRARSVVEILNSQSEGEEFKIYMHGKGNIGYYYLYEKLLQLKVLEGGDGFEDIHTRVKKEISELISQLNCTTRQDADDLERLCKGQLLACFAQFQPESIAEEECESMTLWEMVAHSASRSRGREIVSVSFICGDYE